MTSDINNTSDTGDIIDVNDLDETIKSFERPVEPVLKSACGDDYVDELKEKLASMSEDDKNKFITQFANIQKKLNNYKKNDFENISDNKRKVLEQKLRDKRNELRNMQQMKTKMVSKKDRRQIMKEMEFAKSTMDKQQSEPTATITPSTPPTPSTPLSKSQKKNKKRRQKEKSAS